jgi:hypothetical protein
MKISLLLLGAILLASCSKTNTPLDDKVVQDGKTKVIYDFSIQPKQVIYEDIFESTDGVVGLANKTVYNAYGSSVDYSYKANFLNNTTSSSAPIDGGAITINGETGTLTLEYSVNNNGGAQYTPINADDESLFNMISGFYNGTIEIVVDGDAGDVIPSMTLELTTPENLEILSPELSAITPDVDGDNPDALPQISITQNFTINWNIQDQNENGVAIIVWWSGLTFDSENLQHTNNSTRYVYLTDDDGSYQLPYEMFQEIGENAMIEISVMRGNVEIVESNGKKFKYYAITEAATTPILLVE